MQLITDTRRTEPQADKDFFGGGGASVPFLSTGAIAFLF